MNETDLTKERQQYCRVLAEGLAHISTALARLPEVEQAILFGSYATGRRDLFTDLDILIIMNSSLDFVTRTAEMYRYLRTGVDLDLIVYTPEELARNQSRGFIRCALKGLVIYEKPSN